MGEKSEESSETGDVTKASPSKKRSSRDVIAAYLTTAGLDQKEEEPGDVAKTLATLEAEIKDTDQELESVLTTLKNKRKRPLSGDGKFHGWVAGDASKTKKTAISSEQTEKLHLDEAGATFGQSELDFVTFESDILIGAPQLEVIFSQPMLRDVKKLLGSQSVTGLTQVQPGKQLADSDQEDRGSSSPDSYGSSKENDPEIVNSVTTIYKQSKVSSARKKTNTKNPVLKPQLEVS